MDSELRIELELLRRDVADVRKGLELAVQGLVDIREVLEGIAAAQPTKLDRTIRGLNDVLGG